eukprot:Skav230807  [mRNA]  locus=scaffold851:109959:111050:- [translate_table: standard]
MEVTCLNGASVAVEPWESLQEAKVKVAKALGTFPEAVQISCGGQILCGETLETLENCLEQLKETVEDVEDTVEDFEDGKCHGHPALFGVVDQMRRELARHLHSFEPELVATQKQLAKMEKKKAKMEQKHQELFLGVTGVYLTDNPTDTVAFHELLIDRCLKEGKWSLHEEKALVSGLSKGQRWSKMHIEMDQEYDKLRLLQSELKKKISAGRDGLLKALKSQDAEPDALLAEFDGLARAREPEERFRFHYYPGCSHNGYDSGYESPDELEMEEEHFYIEIAAGIAKELKDWVPRLLRREAWSNSKKSWKYSQAPPAEECDERKGRTALRKCSRQRQRDYRRVLRRDVRNQLQEYSLEVSGHKH